MVALGEHGVGLSAGWPMTSLKRTHDDGGRGVAIFGKFRSFSAVSAPIFASRYAFCSIFQNLPDYAADNFEKWQNFAHFATFANFLLKFHEKFNC